MSSVADAPLADLSRGVDPETLADFAVALYEARGWSVERTDSRRFVATIDTGQRRVSVAHPSEGAPAPDLLMWADTVLAPDRDDVPESADVDIVDAAALGQQLAYAVDRSTAQRLLRSHFGWSPPDLESETDVAGNADTTDAGGRGGTPLDAVVGRLQVVLAAVLILAVAGGLAVVVAEVPGTEPTGPAPDAGTPTPPSQGISVDQQTETASTPTPAPTPDPSPGVVEADLPPGLNTSGELDRTTLVDAHGSVLENTSYRLSMTYQETRNGRPTGIHTETIRVENETRYSVSVGRRGTLRAPVPAIAQTDVFANGSARFERTEDGVERGVLISYDRYLAGHTRFLAVFLDVRSASVTDYRTTNGTTTAYVVTEGNSASLIRGIAGSFDVREDGLVTRARWSYGFSPQLTGYENLSASYEVRVTDVGETISDRPAWVDAGPVVPANATGSVNATETPPENATETPPENATGTPAG